jgi:hypothetical protein
MPTYATLCRQGRSNTSICPRCNNQVETRTHVFLCENETATLQHSQHLSRFLSDLQKVKTPTHLLATFEYKLSLYLQIPYHQRHQPSYTLPPKEHSTLLTAIRHQNILGWDNFMRGYISNLWDDYIKLTLSPSPTNWDVALVKNIFTLATAIWKDRNRVIHGNTRKEASELLRERIREQVTKLY